MLNTSVLLYSILRLPDHIYQLINEKGQLVHTVILCFPIC